MARTSKSALKIARTKPAQASAPPHEPTPEEYRAAFTVTTSDGHTSVKPEPFSRYLLLADKVLDDAIAKQRRVKAQIKPHVERYRKLTGNKR